MRQRTNTSLVRTIRKPLKSDAEPTETAIEGYVYIVSRNADEECYKIGFSRYHPRWRVSRHRKCYDNAKLIAHTSMIRHAPRVEQLSHSDLRDYRFREYCEQCKRVHREWFGISKGMAIQTVSRWAGWISSQPYQAETGKLKKFWQRRLDKKRFKPLIGHYWDAQPGQDWAEAWKRSESYWWTLEQVEGFEMQRYDDEENVEDEGLE